MNVDAQIPKQMCIKSPHKALATAVVLRAMKDLRRADDPDKVDLGWDGLRQWARDSLIPLEDVMAEIEEHKTDPPF